jgi:hypothetical protein
MKPNSMFKNKAPLSYLSLKYQQKTITVSKIDG